MSADVDRVRAALAAGHTVANVTIGAALDAQREEIDAQRARAEAAEAEVARLGRVLSDRKGALESVTPERVRAYLAEHGWTMHKAVTLGTRFSVEFWRHRTGGEALLPTTTAADDYAARMADVARRCGVAEGRDVVFVIAEWLSGGVRP